MLVDDDASLRDDYFVPNGDEAYGANPRHFGIGADGGLVLVQTTVAPDGLGEAIEAALGER